MKIYTTKSGDTFDKIAAAQLGNSNFLPELFKANPDLLGTFEFRAGVKVIIPDVSQKSKVKLPPWK